MKPYFFRGGGGPDVFCSPCCWSMLRIKSLWHSYYLYLEIIASLNSKANTNKCPWFTLGNLFHTIEAVNSAGFLQQCSEMEGKIDSVSQVIKTSTDHIKWTLTMSTTITPKVQMPNKFELVWLQTERGPVSLCRIRTHVGIQSEYVSMQRVY